jgi:hypothetical protein
LRWVGWWKMPPMSISPALSADDGESSLPRIHLSKPT